MNKPSMLLALTLLAFASLANAYELATEITNVDGKVSLSAEGYAKVGLIKLGTQSKGMVYLSGTASVRGSANLAMWVKIDGGLYFSKLPALQGVSDRQNVAFKIPFNAADKTITEVILEVELPKGGRIEIENIALTGG